MRVSLTIETAYVFDGLRVQHHQLPKRYSTEHSTDSRAVLGTLYRADDASKKFAHLAGLSHRVRRPMWSLALTDTDSRQLSTVKVRVRDASTRSKVSNIEHSEYQSC